jgi:uncharacterized membrane protein YkvA (DUF1232 family)
MTGRWGDARLAGVVGGGWVSALLVGAGLVVLSWVVLVALAARLPAGTAREIAGFLPNCVRAARTLARDPRVPRRAKVAVVVAGLWCVSPIDLVPEFLPVIGPLDDAVVVALALRYAARRTPRDVLVAAWQGDPAVLDRLLGSPGRRGRSAGPTVATVPDKRNDSKQRRAARNRASRDALAARRDNVASATTSPSSTGGGTGRAGGGGSGGPAAAAAGASAAPPTGLAAILRSRRPGDRAVLLAVAFSVVSVIFLLFVKVDVDDRGEAIPPTFGGVTVLAREAVTGEPVPDKTESLLSASGPGIIAVMALPVLVTLFAFWGNRRPDRGRMLTFAMFGMLAAVLVTGGLGIYFLPSLIAIGFASFQVRRLEMPARTAAERAAPRQRRRRGRVIDAESREVTDDEPVDDLEASVDDAPADAAPTDDDALAELEAELEAEEAADIDNGEDGTDVGGNGGRKRSR